MARPASPSAGWATRVSVSAAAGRAGVLAERGGGEHPLDQLGVAELEPAAQRRERHEQVAEHVRALAALAGIEERDRRLVGGCVGRGDEHAPPGHRPPAPGPAWRPGRRGRRRRGPPGRVRRVGGRARCGRGRGASTGARRRRWRRAARRGGRARRRGRRRSPPARGTARPASGRRRGPARRPGGRTTARRGSSIRRSRRRSPPARRSSPSQGRATSSEHERTGLDVVRLVGVGQVERRRAARPGGGRARP